MTGPEELTVRQARDTAALARELVGLSCVACGGTGRVGGRRSANYCPDCHGFGHLKPRYRRTEADDDLCLTCAGRGWVDLLPHTRAPGTGPREDCRDCGGTGKDSA